MRFFSRRNHKPAERYSHAIHAHVRIRIVVVFRNYRENVFYEAMRTFNYKDFIGETESILDALYGGLRVTDNGKPMLVRDLFDFLHDCSDDQFMDFIQAAFHTCHFYFHSDSCHLIDSINEILDQEGLGYEIKYCKQEFTHDPSRLKQYYQGRQGKDRIQFIEILSKVERSTHVIAVQPALEVLSDSRFSTANKEMLDAFDSMRRGHFPDAVTACGASFESVMKTVCDTKGWAFDRGRATCNDLVDVCLKNNLFHSFYKETLVSVGRIRNKLGDAHGKGATPEFPPATKVEAEHMIAQTCSHITFLIKQAKL